MLDGELVEVTPDFDNSRAKMSVIGDRHYDGLQTIDGVDISTRTKHRAYMKAHNLTTVDDFKDTWRRNEQERIEFRQTGKDPSRKTDMIEAVQRLMNKR